MCLIATPSREVAQMLASATGKLGLNREAWAALLRVRTGPECPEGNLRELTWDSNPNCGIAKERKKKKKQRERDRQTENYPAKSRNLRHCRAAHRTKDWANTRGELAGCGLAHPPLEAGRQERGSQSQKGAILAPEMASSTKMQAGFQLLTKTSWYSGWLTPTRRVTARDQLPRRDIWHTWDGRAHCHPGNQVAGTGEVIKMHRPPGTVRLPTPGRLSSLDLGSTWSPVPALDSSPAERPGAWIV